MLVFVIDDASPFMRLVGWTGIVFFGLCTLIAAWRFIAQRGPVITISPDGIRDIRVAADVIPWRAVRHISTWSYERQSAMILAVDPAIEAGLSLSTIARWSRGANTALGANGLAVTAGGVKIGYDALLATSVAYWQAHRHGIQRPSSDPARPSDGMPR
jgi:hypothetical protein